MCGIVGIVSHTEVAARLYDGLTVLQHRGQDAAGIATSKDNAFFSVNIVARKPEKNRAETNPYVRKFLKKTPWKPDLVDVFAGKLDYPRYGFLDRLMIRFIMFITQGPTDPTAVVEFTDWQRVEDFSRKVCAL